MKDTNRSSAQANTDQRQTSDVDNHEQPSQKRFIPPTITCRGNLVERTRWVSMGVS